MDNLVAVALLNANLKDRGLQCHRITELDASKLDWGALCQGVHNGGRWISSELDYHINYLELKVFLALQSFVKEMGNIGFLIRMDNRTAIAYVNKTRGTILSQLYLLALQF